MNEKSSRSANNTNDANSASNDHSADSENTAIYDNNTSNATDHHRRNQLSTDFPAKRMQGHWLLAKLGKRVLRPGGIELTERVIEHAKLTDADRIVEFGPGVGRTAQILLAAHPASYIGVDPNPEGADQMQQLLADLEDASTKAHLICATAQATGLPDGCADVVVGEAMLTMQSDEEKSKIISEAFRILAPNGRYVIHELGLHPDDLPPEVETQVSRALSRTIKVGARPLTGSAWSALFTDTGFVKAYETTNPMHLLEPQRVIADEGLVGALKFVFNVLRNRQARARILAMRKVFRQNKDYMNAVGFVFVKPADAA